MHLIVGIARGTILHMTWWSFPCRIRVKLYIQVCTLTFNHVTIHAAKMNTPLRQTVFDKQIYMKKLCCGRMFKNYSYLYS